jgi:hypothetical protein
MLVEQRREDSAEVQNPRAVKKPKKKMWSPFPHTFLCFFCVSIFTVNAGVRWFLFLEVFLKLYYV